MAPRGISVIIPTKDRPQDLARCLDSILNQTLLPDEIVVVDASDSQELNSNTVARVNEKVKTIYLHTAAGVNYQRNIGIEASSGDILFFFDDDVALEKDFINEIVKIFDRDQEGKVAGVCGDIITPEIKSRHGWLVNSMLAAYYALTKVIAIVFLLSKVGSGKFRASGFPTYVYGASEVKTVECLPTGLTAYRKEIFAEFKFDENIRYMTDDDFSYRVSRKYENIFTPYAKLTHYWSPAGRASSYQRRKVFIENSYYLFKKNLPQTFKHKLAFYWALIGLCLSAILRTIVARDIEVLKGLIAGLASIKTQRGAKINSK